MDANGGYRCEGDLGMNGRYSFKSLLLDGEGMDEVGISGAHQLLMTGDLDGMEDSLYRDDVMGGRGSFKSLLLDGETMEEDEIEFSSGFQQGGNGNHVEICPALGVGSEAVERLSSENQGFDCVSHQADVYVEELVDFVQTAQLERNKASPRKRSRGNESSLAVEGKRNASEMSFEELIDEGCYAVDGPHIGLQLQPPSSMPPLEFLSSLGQAQPLQSTPSPMRMQAESLITQLPQRKKQAATSSDVQGLLDSVIARQEMFFKDLLESMERKEALRERIREEKEEKWRAEERVQLGIFNNAMLALTEELLGDSKSGTQSTDKAR